MIKLLAVFVISLVLAYISEKNTQAALASGQHYSARKDWAYVLLVIVLTFFAGLRTYFNDTGAYLGIFRNAPGVIAYFSNPESRDLLSNPLFYLTVNIIKVFTDNQHIYMLLFSAFTQCCFVRFFKRYSSNFTFSIFLYFTLGTFVLTLGAMKQVTAMAILTLAIPFLEKKQWGGYYIVVLVAMMMHTYAIAFAILPLFRRRPWRLFTYAFAAILIVVLLNFQDVITTFLEQADELGKNIAEYEVFDNVSINIFRLAVYAVPPLMSLVLQKWIFNDENKTMYVLVHMSIISLACMSMGTQSGANMFGRMANYFELGTICCLPTMLEKTFDKRSYRLVTAIACACFLGFFTYANAINGNFDTGFQSIGLLEFIVSLFS